MSPSASASPKSPWLVYRATAVVRVRVWPRMLPPTVMADPISATTWPKAVVITAASANRASRATVHAVRQRPAPRGSAGRRGGGGAPWAAGGGGGGAVGEGGAKAAPPSGRPGEG